MCSPLRGAKLAVIRGRTIGTPDLMLSGAGLAMLIDSLLPWWGYGANGWHPSYIGFRSGFSIFLTILIVALIGGSAITRAWSGSGLTRLGTGELTWNLVFLIADAVAFLLIVFRWATLPSLEGASVGAKFGLYFGLIIVLTQAAGAFLAMVAAGDPLPARLRRTPVG
jgi:hypothetical protein